MFRDVFKDSYRVLPSFVVYLVLPFVPARHRFSHIQNLRLIQHLMVEAQDFLIFGVWRYHWGGS